MYFNEFLNDTWIISKCLSIKSIFWCNLLFNGINVNVLSGKKEAFKLKVNRIANCHSPLYNHF